MLFSIGKADDLLHSNSGTEFGARIGHILLQVSRVFFVKFMIDFKLL